VTLYGVALTLLAAGLVGGFAHCGPMCGPFVLMQLGDRAGDTLVLRRAVPGLLPSYHLGRIATYVLLGAVAGGIGAAFTGIAAFHWTLSAILGLAAFSFLTQALKGATRIAPGFLGAAIGVQLGGFIARAARPFLTRPGQGAFALRGFFLGIILGFLPCGFLYAAVATAAATGSAGAGAVAMAAFGLGTVPALAAVGIAGAGLARRWQRLAAAALPPIFLLNAITLGGIALHVAG
jgi:hypothetical protein